MRYFSIFFLFGGEGIRKKVNNDVLKVLVYFAGWESEENKKIKMFKKEKKNDLYKRKEQHLF